ncbi:MAG: hypothetical protein SF182_11615 [Deltaproteobacteria bacterium]|nr:hypothetical protein [Deltaproteobacteria bacterium]
MSIRRGRRRLSRREFIAGSAMTGLALGLPGVLSGCGSDDDATTAATPTPTVTPTATPVPAGPREDRTFHFDLSFADVEDACLHIFNSSDDGLHLESHTAESRAHFRDEQPLLRGVSDQRLTHFAVDVDLPADSLQQFSMTGRRRDTGEAALLGLQIHVPEEVQRTLAAHRRAGGLARRYSAKLRAYGLQQLADEIDEEDLAPALEEFVSPWDAAVSLVFFHPEIMNLDLDQGPEILDLIGSLPCPDDRDPNCVKFLDALAFRIAEHWPATESGLTVFNGNVVPAWAKLVPLIHPQTGEPLRDTMGEPAYHTQLAPETIAAAQQTIRETLRAVFDDPRFEGTNWHNVAGRSATAFSFAAASGTAAQRTGFQLVAEHPPGTNAHGLDIVSLRILDQAKRKLQLEIRNWHLRTHAVNLQFANEAGPLPIGTRGPGDTERSKRLGMVITANTICGIPVPFDTQKYEFEVPADATHATVLFGSLGLGGDPFCPEALFGSIFTIIFNIGLPVIALTAGSIVSIKLSADVIRQTEYAIAEAVQRWLTQVLLQSSPAFARGIFGFSESGSVLDLLKGLLDLVATFVVELLLPVLTIGGLYAVGADIGAAASNFLFAGLQMLGNVATAAELVQTVTEVLGSPALFTNKLSLVMRTTVRIEKDPENFQFPARARHYAVTLIYDEASSVAHKREGEISPGRVDPIDVVFDGVPSGGKVTADVVLTTEEGYIIGRGVNASGVEGPIGPLKNTPSEAGTIVAPIKERLIPLTQATQYEHSLELQYRDGARVWVEGPAPTALRGALCQGQDDRLCGLGGISINQRSGMAGYSFSAGGQGDRPFCGESGSGVMHLVQNVFLGERPERGLKTLPCGFRFPAAIAYERLGTASGRHFFTEPTADGLGYYLQSVVLDETTPLALEQPATWGRFTQALESLAVVPTGYVIGVSRINHKMEILRLPATVLDRAAAPEAVPFAVQKAGPGRREGLLDAPVAVTVFDATILVLETGNARIQAFDVGGTPVRQFRNQTSAIIELEKGGGVEYLDIAADGLGYLYVLSTANGGQAVADYRLDIFTPQGTRLTRTSGVAAARIAVDTFRNLYTLNFSSLQFAPRIEPSLSQWVPSTPEA